MEKIRLLSLIIPAYGQEKTIKTNIKRIDEAAKGLGIPYELIIVVDGKEDKTYENAIKLKRKNIRVLGYQENQGKGHAIKYGVEKAKGDIIGFLDAGMDIDPTGISMLLNHMIWYDADIIVGSKLHPVSRVNYPLWRKIASIGYRAITKVLFGFKVRDSQVGIKIFRKKVAKDVFPLLLVKRFAFDVELLAAAYSIGYTKIYEAPVKLEFKVDNSSITKSNFWKTVFLMLVDTLAVFYRVRILNYYNKKKNS